MNTREWSLFGLLLIAGLVLLTQPAAASPQQFSGLGYEGVQDFIESGTWQSYELDVTSLDDYDILALAYSEANDFELYVYDPASDTVITEATVPYSSENGLNFIWAVSTIRPGRYAAYVHARSGSGYFALIHFYKSTQIQKPATPTPKYTRGEIVGKEEGSTSGWLVLDFTPETDSYSLLWVTRSRGPWMYREWEPITEDRKKEEDYDQFVLGEIDPDTIEQA